MQIDHARQFYIGGQWVAPSTDATLDVINPATEQPITTIAMGAAADVDAAVAAARAAFETYSQTSREERLALLDRIIEVYQSRMADIGTVISAEMGAPLKFAQRIQAGTGLGHLMTARTLLADFEFEESRGTTLVVREPVGVCGLITPWNWPINQVTCKVAPALATGCTMVLKPSEVAPLSAILFADVLDEAGVPAGVFNLVNGDGATVGGDLVASWHRHGVVHRLDAPASKSQVARPRRSSGCRRTGGKSANIILDADFAAVAATSTRCAATRAAKRRRMLVPRAVAEARRSPPTLPPASPSAIRTTPPPTSGRWCRRCSTAHPAASSRVSPRATAIVGDRAARRPGPATT